MAEKFYIGLASGSLQQGDVFPNIPFPIVRLSEFSYLDGDEVRTASLRRAQIPTQGQCVLDYEVGWAIIVTQTCDLQSRPNKEPLPVSVARISLFSQLKILVDKNQKNRNLAIVEIANERGRHPSLFPLASYRSKKLTFEGGVATLHSILSVQFDKLLQAKRRLRLSQLALQSFQERLGCGYLRTALPEKERLPEFLNLPELSN